MTPEERASIGHSIATQCASMLVKRSLDVGLDWRDISIECETVLAIVTATMAHLARATAPERFAQEFVEVLTARAHLRVQALLRGVEFEG
jgi:hypothetical protein